MSTLTEEQRKRIEENKRKALERRALKSGINLNANNQNSTAPVVQTSKFKLKKNHSLTSNLFVGPSTSTVTLNTPQVKSAVAFPVSGTTNNSKPGTVPFRPKGTIQTSWTLRRQTSWPSKLRFRPKFRHPVQTSYLMVPSRPHEVLKGHCMLLSRKRFYVDIIYHKQVIEIFKSVPGGLYDMQTKKWNFSIDYHDKLVTLLKPLQPNILLIPLPRLVVQVFLQAEEKKQIEEYDLSHMDQVLVNALLPFQKIGLYFGIQHGGRVLLADDMGLGKTIQALAISNYFAKDWPLLVVTPSSVRYSWLDAFQMWLPSVGADEISVINSSKDHIPDDKVIIMSYDLLPKLKGAIINRSFKSVIFDESHFLKNHKTARTKAAQAVMKIMNRIIMLSGTPALSRPIELFTQISPLCPKLFSSFHKYGLRYCNGSRASWGWNFCGSSNMEELQLLLEELVMIRRLKSDVIKELPSKCRQMIVLNPQLVSTKSKILRAMTEKLRQTNISGMKRRGALLKYFNETGSVKIPAVCEYVLDLLESDIKFICFAHHQKVINRICECIEKKKIDFIRIDGSVPSKQRKNLCDHFQLNNACKVAVLSITAANCGITLTAASLVVFAELFWNPGILTQAEDRAHRIGQDDSVTVQYLVAKNTADDEMWPLVQLKLDVLKKAGLSQDNFKDSDIVLKDDPSQPSFYEFWNDLELSQISDFDDDIPEKRPKLE